MSENKQKDDCKVTSLPPTRVRIIMKSVADPDVTLKYKEESLHIVTRATELFIQYLAKGALKCAKGKLITYDSLSTFVHSEDKLEIVNEVIPKKITVKKYREILSKHKTDTFDWASSSESDSEDDDEDNSAEEEKGDEEAEDEVEAEDEEVAEEDENDEEEQENSDKEDNESDGSSVVEVQIEKPADKKVEVKKKSNSKSRR